MKRSRNFTIIVLLMLSVFLLGDAGRLWAFSVDVTRLTYTDPAGQPPNTRSVDYDFSAGSITGDTISIPDTFVTKPPLDAALTYTFGPYPDPTNDITLQLNTGSATLNTSSNGDAIINTNGIPPSQSLPLPEWSFTARLQNFAGMTDSTKGYYCQIGMGSPVPDLHPELTAVWQPDGNLELKALIFDDTGNGSDVWSIPATVVTGQNPSSTIVDLQLRRPADAASIIFEYNINGGGWIVLGTYTIPLAQRPIQFLSFPAAFPYVALNIETPGGGDGFVSPYMSDANTILLDHFEGSTSASINAYSETGAACGSAKASATPNSSYVSGPNGLSQALDLESPTGQPTGSGTYLQYPGGQLLSQASGTIEFWVYLSSYGAGVPLVDQGPFYGSCAGWTFGMGISATGQLNAGAWVAINNPGITMNSGAVAVPLHTWTHVAASWGSAGAKLYINGVQVGSDSNTGMPAGGYGGSVMLNSGAAGHQIDELRISNVQRTSFAVSGQAGTGTHSASGTYTWNSTAGEIGLTWLSSDFLCDGPDLGTETISGVTITDTTMTWLYDDMTWSRASGTAGDIVGTWTITEATGNTYSATFNSDGTMLVTAVIIQCGGDNGGQNPSAYSQHWWNGYYVQLQYRDSPPTATAVNVTGPGISSGSMSLGYDANDGSWNSWAASGPQIFWPTNPGGLPFAYTFSITDGSGMWTADSTISCFQEAFATNLAPTGSVPAGPLTFSWTGIADAGASYGLEINDSMGNRIWSRYDISGTSIAYAGPPLASGITYNYLVSVQSSSACPNGASFAQASFTYGGGAAFGGTIFTGEAAFAAATLPTKYINFEDRDTSAGKISFAGNEYAATDGLIFTSPNSHPLWIYPANGYWNSRHLSPGEAPYENGDSTEDSLTLQFNPPVTAIGWTFLDYGGTGGESIRVYAQDNSLIYENTDLSSIAGAGAGQGNNPFWGISSPDRPIARVEIVEAANDGDDVAYDNFRFSPLGQAVGITDASGTINDGTGSGIDGASVEQMGAAVGNSTTSAGGGLYTLPLPSGIPSVLKFGKDGYTPTYSPLLMVAGPSTTLRPFSLFPAGQLGSWGVPAEMGIIRARVRDQQNGNIGGATVTAFSRIHSSDSYYQICYDDACNATQTATDPATGIYIVKNVEPGDTVTVTAHKEGMTFNQPVFQIFADGIHQGSITGVPGIANLLRNGGFNGNLNGWTIQPSLEASGWNPFQADGTVSLHPPSYDYAGTIIYQNLNVTGIGGKAANLSLILSNLSMMSSGNTIAVYLSYVDSANTINRVKIFSPDNPAIEMNTLLNAPPYTFPDDAQKLIKLEIVKQEYGDFSADNILLTVDGATAGPIPTLTGISSAGGLYGSVVAITGQNFGTIQGRVVIRGIDQTINSWSDTSIEITITDSTRTGHLSIIVDNVQSYSAVPNTFEITSPYYVVNLLNNNAKVIQGQTAEFLFRSSFFNNFTTTTGITLQLQGSGAAALAGKAVFAPLPVKGEGGVVLKINTTDLAAANYTADVVADNGGETLPVGTLNFQVVTVKDVRFYYWDDSQTPSVKTYSTTRNITKQGPFSVYTEVTGSDDQLFEVDAGVVLSEFTTSAPLLGIYHRFWGYDLYAAANGATQLRATAPDGTSWDLPIAVNFPASPGDSYISAIGLSAPEGTPSIYPIYNNRTEPITWYAQGTTSLGWIGQDTSGTMNFQMDFLDRLERSEPDYRSATSTFTLQNRPADIGTAILLASTGDGQATAAVPLTTVNAPGTGLLSFGIRNLDPQAFAEMFQVSFYGTDDQLKFQRDIFAMHIGNSPVLVGNVPPGTYKLLITPGNMSVKSQWWPNAQNISAAQPVIFTADQTTENIYFFALSAPTISFSGSVFDSTLANPIDGASIYVPDLSLSATTDASGNFVLNGIPEGQPFTIQVSSPGYITVYSGELNTLTDIVSPWPFALLTQTEVAQWQAGGQNIWQAGKGMITSRVVNSANPFQTLEGVQISATSSQGNTYNVTYNDGAAFGGTATAANGLFYIYGVEPGDTVTVTAGKPGWVFNTTTYTVRSDSMSEQLVFGFQSNVVPVATNLSPIGDVTTAGITFSFTGIGYADGYTVHLFGPNGDMIWQSAKGPATSVPYTGAPLPPGSYTYLVRSWVGDNMSVALGNFNYAPPVQYMAGDINHDQRVDLADAIIALRLAAGFTVPNVFIDADVNKDGRIGPTEAVFILQRLAGLRVTDLQAALAGVNASLEAYKTTINSKGTSLTAADLLPFFHPNYLDNGLNRIQGAQDDLPDEGELVVVETLAVNQVLSFDKTRGIIEVEITFAGTENGFAVSETFIETMAFDAASGKWLWYGNQRIGEFSVWTGATRTMTSAGNSDSNILHFHLYALPGTVNQVFVSGPGLAAGGVLFTRDSYPRQENGIIYDQFTSPNGTELHVSHVSAVGETYTFIVTRADSTMVIYNQTLQEVISGVPAITSPASHVLAAANIGSLLGLTWTVPAGITAENIMIQGQVCGDSGCSNVDGTVLSDTNGTITLPSIANPTSAYIDVRVHHGEDVFMNCRFEFN